MHFAIIFTSCSCVQDEAQWLHIAAQFKQASIQALYSWYPFMIDHFNILKTTKIHAKIKEIMFE
jgi:hypothetical protein